MRTLTILVTALIGCLAFSAAAAENANVYEVGQLRPGDNGVPAGWTLASGDAAHVELLDDDGEPFVRLSGPAKIRTYQMYETWHPMEVTFKVRASASKRGLSRGTCRRSTSRP